MYKEVIICIIIVTVLFIGNTITEGYTSSSVEELSKQLTELKEELIKKEKSNEFIYEKMEQIENEWQIRHQKLAYYIEHDELEKVETDITLIKSYIEVEESNDCINKIDECIFIMEHIEERDKFNLENIF